jgi:molecular chaperone DnaK
MVREAEQNASSDKDRREKIERKNQADSLAYQAEKQLQELGDKVPATDKTKVEGLVKELREAVAKEDDEQIKKLTPELQQALFAVGSNIYQQAGGGAAPGAEPQDSGSTPSSGSGDDVIDADFTESK